jgi:hypothetical protein
MYGSTCYVGLLLLTMAIAPIGAPQTQGGASSSSNDRDPKPEAATRAILEAFKTFKVVAVGDNHGTKDLNDFVLSLVRHPEFPDAVNDIVVEGTNSLLQPMLDRYIAGEAVPIEEARQLWREGTVPTGVNDFQAQLFQLVRRINQQLPLAKRLRVLAGEPPVDWSNLNRRSAIRQREAHIAAVVEEQVLAKNRKALMFYGALHVAHGVLGGEMAVGRYEQKYPGVTFVITPYLGAEDGDHCGWPKPVAGVAHETKMASWPVPSLVRTKGTWLADFARAEWFENSFTALLSTPPGPGSPDPIDAYLYLGPPDLLLGTQPSVFTFTDKDLLAEFRRRLSPNAGDAIWARIDPDKVRELDRDVLRCDGLVER